MMPTAKLQVINATPVTTRQPQSNNVLTFPSHRVLLPVTLLAETEEESRSQLGALLHSPPGVYVTRTERSRSRTHVWFDIARDDMPFMLHTLITTLPEAIIGAVTHPAASKEGH